jgi:uncharacterized membrane protein YozB (DUF420 family)
MRAAHPEGDPMQIPAFSIFSAISELFVTAGVLYIIRRNWIRRTFPLGVFLAVALFEALVNVMYMATRAAQTSAGTTSALSPALRIFYAGHGMLSLLAYLVFVVLGVFAYQDQKEDRFWFRDRPRLTWAFLAVWTISIVSGEAIFVARYLL